MFNYRTSLPTAVLGATEWSDSFYNSQAGIIRLLRSQSDIHRELVDATTRPQGMGGRPPLPGEWAVIYLAYIASYERDLIRWWRATDNPLWRLADFANRPSYDTTHYNFERLEQHADDFRAAAQKIIQRAGELSGYQVGSWIHIDGTEAEAHSRLHHACPANHQTCRRRRNGQPGSSGGQSRRGGPIAKQSSPDARRYRHAHDKTPTNGPGALSYSRICGYDEKDRPLLAIGGCVFRVSDGDAGIRAYSRGGKQVKFWHGYYHLKATDHFTGAVIATIVVNASVNEKDAYGWLLNAIYENLGRYPIAVVGDRGFAYEEIYELNTRLGIASIFPFRPKNQHEKREDLETDLYDRHGVPRCRHCGSEGRFVSFATGGNSANSSPRITFVCQAPSTPGCAKRQTIACSHNWRLLLPLSRLSEAYHALKESHMHYEAAHWRWRDRWRVAGDNSQTRPLRRGRACQVLRSEAALLCEWLLVGHRQGWLVGHRPQHGNTPYVHTGKGSLNGLTASRWKKGLHLPEGPVREAHIAEVKEFNKARDKMEAELSDVFEGAATSLGLTGPSG